eukprot:2962186-Alexandrium_andersonii.AAC.1
MSASLVGSEMCIRDRDRVQGPLPFGARVLFIDTSQTLRLKVPALQNSPRLPLAFGCCFRRA